MMRWQVWYSDGTYISSEDVTPYCIERRTDVQVIVQGDKEKGWVTKSGHDFYVWDDRGGGAKWFNATYSGREQYLMKPGYKCILFGYEIDKKAFYEIFNAARKEFGEKLSYERNERHPE